MAKADTPSLLANTELAMVSFDSLIRKQKSIRTIGKKYWSSSDHHPEQVEDTHTSESDTLEETQNKIEDTIGILNIKIDTQCKQQLRYKTNQKMKMKLGKKNSCRIILNYKSLH